MNKQQMVLSGTQLTTKTHNGYATISKSELEFDSEGNVFGGDVVIRFGVDGMPPHNYIIIDESDIFREMSAVQSDMRKWN